MQLLYASHLRKIPLDDGKERSHSGEVYAAHEVDAALAAKDAEIQRLRQYIDFEALELEFWELPHDDELCGDEYDGGGSTESFAKFLKRRLG